MIDYNNDDHVFLLRLNRNYYPGHACLIYRDITLRHDIYSSSLLMPISLIALIAAFCIASSTVTTAEKANAFSSTSHYDVIIVGCLCQLVSLR